MFNNKNLPPLSIVRNISYLWIMKAVNQEGTLNEPTKSELEILQVLWKSGPSTVRFVNDFLNEQKRAVQYTSTLKLMQIMTEKEMLTRDASSMKHVYSAAIEEHQTKGMMLEKFVDTMYNGSSTNLMMQLLGNNKTSKQELDAIRAMLDQLDNK